MKNFKFYLIKIFELHSSPPAGLDTWGLDPIDYRLNHDVHLIRRYPSPLTHFGLGSKSQKQKKVMNSFFNNKKSNYHIISLISSCLVYPVLQALRSAEMVLAVLLPCLLIQQQKQLIFLILNIHILKEFAPMLHQNFIV